MALTKEQLAGEYVYELYNTAEHAGRVAETAHRKIGNGDFAGALAAIKESGASFEMVEYRYREAIAKLEEASK